jgi:uncharacterized membrane protein YccC
VGTIATLVLVGATVVTMALVRVERGRVPNYVTVGRILFVLMGVALLPGDPGVAVLVLFAAFLCRLRERSYADRFRSRAEALSQFDHV